MTQPLAVTFDLWQTLIIDRDGWAEVRKTQRLRGALAALGQAGVAVTWDQVEGAYRRCFDACQAVRARGEDVSFSEQIHIFLNEIQQGFAGSLAPATLAGVADAYRDGYFSRPLPAAPGAHEVLDNLQRRGVRLGLISNTGTTPGVTFRKALDHLGLLHYFDVLTFSDEVALAKPAPQIFNLTLEQLGVGRESAIHVGDTPEHDVMGAKAAGMGSVWVSHGRREGLALAPDAVAHGMEQLLPELDRLIEQRAG